MAKLERTSRSVLYLHNQSHDVAVHSEGEKEKFCLRAQIPTIDRIGSTPYRPECWVNFTVSTPTGRETAHKGSQVSDPLKPTVPPRRSC